jgi:N-acetylglutamate synthase-like GNAT family acetyltransferase
LKTNDILNLRWVRIFDPIHIPREYVEQIKERTFEVDKFYKLMKHTCMREEAGKMVLNPVNLLYVLINDENHVKGFCWMVVDVLNDALVINSFSMDNEYWGNGRSIQLLKDKAQEIKEGAQLQRVYWITRCPKHSEKYGFKRSKHILMEYSDGRNNDGKRCKASGASATDDAPATEVSK